MSRREPYSLVARGAHFRLVEINAPVLLHLLNGRQATLHEEHWEETSRNASRGEGSNCFDRRASSSWNASLIRLLSTAGRRWSAPPPHSAPERRASQYVRDGYDTAASSAPLTV